MGVVVTMKRAACVALSSVLLLGCGAQIGSELEDEHNDAEQGQGDLGDFDGNLGGDGSSGDNGLCGDSLVGTIRDFQSAHPDFEYVIAAEDGIVKPELGPDGKPVYASSGVTKTTTGKAAFDQWYRDVSGVNQGSPLVIKLVEGNDGIHTYDNSSFFPIDGAGYGNEGNPHNYHFTYELRTKFKYEGGEVFRFTGDDDLFVFINGKLVIDIGGVHGAMSEQVKLDKQAEALGIEKGGIHSLDFFFAERHTSESNFRIDISISFTDCNNSPK